MISAPAAPAPSTRRPPPPCRAPSGRTRRAGRSTPAWPPGAGRHRPPAAATRSRRSCSSHGQSGALRRVTGGPTDRLHRPDDLGQRHRVEGDDLGPTAEMLEGGVDLLDVDGAHRAQVLGHHQIGVERAERPLVQRVEVLACGQAGPDQGVDLPRRQAFGQGGVGHDPTRPGFRRGSRTRRSPRPRRPRPRRRRGFRWPTGAATRCAPGHATKRAVRPPPGSEPVSGPRPRRPPRAATPVAGAGLHGHVEDVGPRGGGRHRHRLGGGRRGGARRRPRPHHEVPLARGHGQPAAGGAPVDGGGPGLGRLARRAGRCRFRPTGTLSWPLGAEYPTAGSRPAPNDGGVDDAADPHDGSGGPRAGSRGSPRSGGWRTGARDGSTPPDRTARPGPKAGTTPWPGVATRRSPSGSGRRGWWPTPPGRVRPACGRRGG